MVTLYPLLLPFFFSLRAPCGSPHANIDSGRDFDSILSGPFFLPYFLLTFGPPLIYLSSHLFRSSFSLLRKGYIDVVRLAHLLIPLLYFLPGPLCAMPRGPTISPSSL